VYECPICGLVSAGSPSCPACGSDEGSGPAPVTELEHSDTESSPEPIDLPFDLDRDASIPASSELPFDLDVATEPPAEGSLLFGLEDSPGALSSTSLAFGLDHIPENDDD